MILEDVPRRPNQNSQEAAYDKTKRSLPSWPIKGDDDDNLDANFRDFAVEALQIST